MPKKQVLESDSDDDDSGDGALRVNEDFAAAFSAREEKRLAAKNAALGLDGSSDDDESDSESSDDDAARAPADVDVLATINAIRGRDPRVYDGATRFFEERDAPAASEKKAKKQTFKDVTRARILAGDAGADSDDDDDRGPVDAKGLAYDAEQRALRRGVLDAVADDEEDDLFTTRAAAAAPEPADAAALKDELDRFAATSKDPAADAFLADFVGRRRWADGGGAGDDGDEDDDAFDDATDAFEAKYNFRFEHPDGGAIATHDRDVVGSLRRPDDRRKAKRAERKERKAAERRRKEEELRRLKNLRRVEVAARLDRVAAESGGQRVAEEALEGDWDPAAHDAQMAAAFGDAYYEGEDAGDVKEVARGPTEEEDDEEEDEEADEDDDDEAAAIDEAAIDRSVRREAATALKASDDDDAGGGGTFKYRSVEASDYGLTTQEILEAPDKELQQLVSIKRLAPYRDREFVVSADRRKKWRRDQAAKAEARRLAHEAERKQRKRAKRKEREKAAAAADASAPAKPEKKRKRKRRVGDAAPAAAGAPAAPPKKKTGAKALSKERRAAYGL